MRLGSSSTPQRARLNQWPGSILTLQSIRSSRQCSLQENEGHCFLGCLWSYYLGWFHTSQFNSKCICLSGNSKQTQRGYSEKRPGLLTTKVLLHNNAQPHTAATTVNPLNSWGWGILPHQPYSPDLPPLDFHMFSKMKKHLRGQWFHSKEDINSMKDLVT